jgi:hypothetical protein
MRQTITRSLFIMGLFTMVSTVANAKMTACQMTFEMKGWSIFYKVANGTGHITCDNGQTADVKLQAKGGGITAGKSEIHDGTGKFSEVRDIDDLFGTYASGSAHAGAGKEASAGVVTKGEVSLALAGKGTGIEVGISFGKFTITKR